jgi:hypothetical protein
MGAPAAPGSRLRPEGWGMGAEEGGRRKGPGGSLHLADCPYVKFGCGMEGAPTSSRWGRGRGELLPGVPTGPGCGGGRAVPIRVRHRRRSTRVQRTHAVREHLKQDAARAATPGDPGPEGPPGQPGPPQLQDRRTRTPAGMQPARRRPPPGPAGRHVSVSVSLPCLKSASDRNLLLPRRAAGAWAGGRGGAAWLWHLGRTSSGSHGRGRALRRLQRSSLRSVRVPAAAAAPSRSAQAHWLLPGRDPDRHGDSPGGYPMTVTVTARG